MAKPGPCRNPLKKKTFDDQEKPGGIKGSGVGFGTELQG